MTDTLQHIAQLNIGRTKYDIDDPRMADFMNNLDRINALAERSPGFIWRYQDESGAAVETKRDDDPRELLNISVWETVEDLERYVFGTIHARFYARRDDWFERMTQSHFVMWPVSVGHLPSVEEALARLAELERDGPSDRVFGWERMKTLTLWREKRCA